MADLNKKRKFQCPNCDHWVKFKVNPESTLIACDHCGQLTRVTMKTSEPLASSDRPQQADQPSDGKPSVVLSEAFDDLDLEGLEHSQYVKSKTLAQVDIKAKAEPTPQGKAKENSSQAKSQASEAPQNQSTSSAGSEPSRPPNAGLSAPIPPPFVPAPPAADVSESKLPSAGSRPAQQSAGDASYSAAPVPTPLVPKPPQAELKPTEPSEDFFAIPPSRLDEPGTTGLDTDSVSGQWQGKVDDDVEILDLGELEEFSAVSQPELGGGTTSETHLGQSQVPNESVRIICKICDTLNYFPKSEDDQYICQDCYTKMDSHGRPKARPKPETENVEVSATPPGDEIDRLISTAIDKNSPGDSWHNEGTTRLVAAQTISNENGDNEGPDNIVEDLDGEDLVELPESANEDSNAMSDSGELRLAPLEEPTEAYRDSLMPQGFVEPTSPETSGEETSAAAETESVVHFPDEDALPHSVSEDSSGPTGATEDSPGTEPLIISEDSSEPLSHPSAKQEQEPVSPPTIEITDEEPVVVDDTAIATASDIAPYDLEESPAEQQSKSTDNKSLFLDGGEISPEELTRRPGQPNLGGRVNVPVPPPFQGEANPATASHQPSSTTNQKPGDEDEDPDSDPFADGWLGNWLPVVTSSWVLLESILLTASLSVLMSLGYVVMTPTFGTGVRIVSSLGVMLLLPVTLAVWSLLTATIIEGKEDYLPWKGLTLNEFLTHLTRLGFCAVFSMPGMVLGSAVGYPVTGTLISMLYTSPLALLWITMCELSGQGVVAFDKSVIDRLARNRELIMSAIAVLGMAGFSVIPFGAFAGFLPFPGIFTFAPMLVVFAVIFAIQIRRLVLCLKVLENLNATT